MALKKLPLNVQSKFCASTQIKSYKRAVEELVYNSFDADSTSIAIRVHIQGNYIQVVDNGHGVSKNDFNLLGQRYATSRQDNDITKSIHKYGCSGQSLANIIEVSQSVKIISRCKNSEETWMKHYHHGKGQECQEVPNRPSVGTTVEIKGFLYNLKIHNKSIKATQELQNIKAFLVQISLIHCNTSISLRDNLENEIIFKIHKNRDIYQTLSALLNIDKSNLQELQVEKNEYKVTGFILKKDVEPQGYQWIYANRKLIESSNLHKIVNQNLAKSFPSKKKTKLKIQSNQDDVVTKKYLPDYFIFITCPYNDYDIISNPKESILEFKNSRHIIQLLEKLMKFYADDTNFGQKTDHEIPFKTVKNMKPIQTDTRNEVKLIMKKILGSQQKKLSQSHLHNGVKGKMIKRKIKKHVGELKSKVKEHNAIDRAIALETSQNNNNLLELPTDNNDNTSILHTPTKKQKYNMLANSNKVQKRDKSKPRKVKNKMLIKNPIISKFEENTASVQKRCHFLAKKVDSIYNFEKKRKRKVFTNEIIQYSNVIRGNKRLSIRKKMDEIIIQEYLPLVQKSSIVHHINRHPNAPILKSDDLIRPVTIIDQSVAQGHKVRNAPRKLNFYDLENSSCDLKVPKLTYESHSYYEHTEMRRTKENLFKHDDEPQFSTNISQGHLVLSIEPGTNLCTELDYAKSGVVRDNLETFIRENAYGRKNNKFIHSDIFKSSSYSTQFLEVHPQLNKTRSVVPVQNIITEEIPPTSKSRPVIGSTYTIVDTENRTNIVNNALTANSSVQNTYDIPETHCEESLNTNRNDIHQSPILQNSINRNEAENNSFNVIFISNSQHSMNALNINNSVEPLNVCETILQSQNQCETEDLSIIFDSANNVDEHVSTLSQLIEKLQISAHHNKIRDQEESHDKEAIETNNQTERDHDLASQHFNGKYRRRYIPKGMSQIFENCNSKNICDYDCDQDYFEEINSEIFEPRIQNVKELATRDIERVNNKLNKDNAALTFDDKSLKQAKVLGQVDCKFIATKIKDQANTQDHLVLFDQHAVHERIRLEENMAEYIEGDRWKSVTLDGLKLKLTKDEIVYLHNHKDKFRKLGLEWTVLDGTEVSVRSIPKAILGKHPRQVDVILKAVKSLIKEEINMIKEQGGCVSLYPTAIMDLVFSEACRYAVMFGDLLSRADCVTLLNSLSKCKTPFQCAHGRPVMAVLVDIETERREYKINFTRVKEFQRKMCRFNKKS